MVDFFSRHKLKLFTGLQVQAPELIQLEVALFFLRWHVERLSEAGPGSLGTLATHLDMVAVTCLRYF